MPWWGWIATGALLLAGELTVDAEFYLVFLGVAALATGVVGLVGIELPHWGQWLTFAAISVALLLVFRRRIYEWIRGPLVDLAEGVTGDRGVANERIAPGGEGSVELRGTRWTARNAGDAAIEAGARVTVLSAQGLRLEVRGD